jgi:hypothetical protein
MEDGERVGWTGRSHRYDIFKRTITKSFARSSETFTQWGLRWSHGGGDGWFITDTVSWTTDRTSAILLETISQESHEERRWALCNAICNTADSHYHDGCANTKRYIEKAFVDGHMKKRRRNGCDTVEYVTV